MKKLVLMTLFASTFACSSSDDNSQPPVPNTPPETQHLSGRWNYCEQSTTESDYVIENGVLTYTKSSGYVSKYNVISANDLTIKLEMFYYTTNLGEVNVPQNQRVTEICNKAE